MTAFFSFVDAKPALGWNLRHAELDSAVDSAREILATVGTENSTAQARFSSLTEFSRDPQEYLALGGMGFLLSDGRLSNGCETIEEAYYTMHLWRGAYPSVGLQNINNSGYSRDRAPVIVPAVRLHLEFQAQPSTSPGFPTAQMSGMNENRRNQPHMCSL